MSVMSVIYIALPVMIMGLFWYFMIRGSRKTMQAVAEGAKSRKAAKAAKAAKVGQIAEKSADEIDAHVRRRPLVAASGDEAHLAPAPVRAAMEVPADDNTQPEIETSEPVSHNDGAIEPVEEPVSAVLKRQVPPRFDETPTSWLGGLPQMPETTEWPRSISSEYPDQGERPLHFLAQIACADLPADLWGGLGPRTGWLLFFVDPNQGTPDDFSSHSVIHIDQLGPEHPAPFDLGPVHDKVYTGGSYRWLPKDEPVPPQWRRWPVDITSFTNELHHDGPRTFATPENFAETLYPDQDIGDFRTLPNLYPYTYGQAIAALRGLASQMRAEPRAGASDACRDLLMTENGFDVLYAGLEREIAEVRGQNDDEYRARKLTRLDTYQAILDQTGSAELLIQWLEKDRERLKTWRGGIAEGCDLLESMLAREPADTPLTRQDWEELQQSFAGKRSEGYELSIDYRSGGEKQLQLRSYSDTAALNAPQGTTQQTVHDWLNPDRSSLIPDELTNTIAAACRDITSNRPHRMGGYHDGVQSDAQIGPSKDVLLLQIASDDAMDWCWGDVGAMYFWIRVDHLEQSDFSGVQMYLECH